jgi:ribosomal protein L37AE/L43A
MTKKIDKGCDDVEAGIRFHISSARMSITKMSFVAFQRYLDRVEASMYRCRQCGWSGSGKSLQPMEISGESDSVVEQNNDSWYSCPQCESVIDISTPILSPVG